MKMKLKLLKLKLLKSLKLKLLKSKLFKFNIRIFQYISNGFSDECCEDGALYSLN